MERLPQLIDRIQSTFIDTVFIIILMFVFSNVLDSIANPPDWVRILLFCGIFFIYEPLCMSLGYTLGNFIIGIRVRKAQNTSKRINIFQSVIRYIFKLLLGWLSFLTINRNKKHRAIHDIIVGTIVVYNNPKKNISNALVENEASLLEK